MMNEGGKKVIIHEAFYKNLKVNRVIVSLTLSDIFSWGVYMVISPLAGIYLGQKLGLNVAEIVGVGTSIFYLTRGLTQIPIGLITDRIKKDRDDIIFLMFGNLLMGTPFVLYPLIETQYSYYILQFIFGLGASMNLVTWRKLFAKNLDKDKEGLEYSLYDTTLSATTALMGLIAGYTASQSSSSFDLLMIIAGITMTTASIWSVSIYFVKDRKSSV